MTRQSRARRVPDRAADVVLRRLGAGSEAGTVLEEPIPLDGIDTQTAADVVAHVGQLVLDVGVEAFLQILTSVQADGGGGQLVLVQVPLIAVGQTVVAISFEHIPDNHAYIACRLVVIGEGDARVDYACWLSGARAR